MVCNMCVQLTIVSIQFQSNPLAVCVSFFFPYGYGLGCFFVAYVPGSCRDETAVVVLTVEVEVVSKSAAGLSELMLWLLFEVQRCSPLDSGGIRLSYPSLLPPVSRSFPP